MVSTTLVIADYRLDLVFDIGDASAIEMVPMAVLIIAILAVGIYPVVLTDVFNAGLEPLVNTLDMGAKLP